MKDFAMFELRVYKSQLENAIEELVKSKKSKRLILKINKRINKDFGFDLNGELTEPQLCILVALHKKLSIEILDGIDKKLTRKAIKNSLYSLIKRQAEAFKLVVAQDE